MWSTFYPYDNQVWNVIYVYIYVYRNMYELGLKMQEESIKTVVSDIEERKPSVANRGII